MKQWIIIDHKLHRYLPNIYKTWWLAYKAKEELINKYRCKKNRFEILITNI